MNRTIYFLTLLLFVLVFSGCSEVVSNRKIAITPSSIFALVVAVSLMAGFLLRRLDTITFCYFIFTEWLIVSGIGAFLMTRLVLEIPPEIDPTIIGWYQSEQNYNLTILLPLVFLASTLLLLGIFASKIAFQKYATKTKK